MRYTFRNDKKKRLEFKNFELSSRFLKINLLDQSSPNAHKFRLANKFNNQQKNRFVGRTKNHCFLSTRAIGILKIFGLSRIMFRELANSGRLAGVRRSSW